MAYSLPGEATATTARELAANEDDGLDIHLDEPEYYAGEIGRYSRVLA